MTTYPPARPWQWRLLVVALACVLMLILAVVYAAAVLQPGDGAYTVLDSNRPRQLLEVAVREPRPGGLQTGDLVLSLGGRSVDDWLNDVWQPAGPLPETALDYTVERSGAVVSLTQPLLPPTIASLLSDNWAYLIYALYMLLVALVVVVRRPHLPAGHALLLISSAVVASSTAYFLALRPSDLRRGWVVVLYLWSAVPLYILVPLSALHFTFVFPRLRPVAARRRWLIPAIYAVGFSIYVLLLALSWPAAGNNVARLQTLLNSPDVVALSCFILIVAHAGWILRTTTDPTERRQIRWVAWGIVVAIVPWTLLSVIPEVLGYEALLPPVAIGLLWCALPTSLAIAILRERLFDIDLLVNRTLVYGVLSGLLALIYFGAVVILQSALGLITGQRNSQLVIVLSTLTIAALFTPLRARVQSAIDRRFYRRHYDAGRILAAFGLAARTIVDLQPLSEQLASVVQETMEPAHVGFAWVHQPPAPTETPPS